MKKLIVLSLIAVSLVIGARRMVVAEKFTNTE